MEAPNAALGTSFCFAGLILSVDQFQAIFALISTILGVILMIWNLIDKIRAKYKKAKEDGKITKEEMEDIADTIKDGIQDIAEETDKVKDHIDEIKKN